MGKNIDLLGKLWLVCLRRWIVWQFFLVLLGRQKDYLYFCADFMQMHP